MKVSRKLQVLESRDSLKMSFNNSAVAYLPKVSAVGDTFSCNQTRSNLVQYTFHVYLSWDLNRERERETREVSDDEFIESLPFTTGLDLRKFCCSDEM